MEANKPKKCSICIISSVSTQDLNVTNMATLLSVTKLSKVTSLLLLLAYFVQAIFGTSFFFTFNKVGHMTVPAALWYMLH